MTDARVLCAQCNVRPPSRSGHPYCSKACSNKARARPLAERFLNFYRPGHPSDCWPWIGPTDRDGYGVITTDMRRQLRAHRIAYERVHGQVQDGKHVLHHCDNPPCCNPAHLFVGTIADNNMDKRHKNRHPHGESHPRARLTAADVRSIRARYAYSKGGNQLAHDYGVTRDTIYDIVQRRSWTHID